MTVIFSILSTFTVHPTDEQLGHVDIFLALL